MILRGDACGDCGSPRRGALRRPPADESDSALSKVLQERVVSSHTEPSEVGHGRAERIEAGLGRSLAREETVEEGADGRFARTSRAAPCSKARLGRQGRAFGSWWAAPQQPQGRPPLGGCRGHRGELRWRRLTRPPALQWAADPRGSRDAHVLSCNARRFAADLIHGGRRSSRNPLALSRVQARGRAPVGLRGRRRSRFEYHAGRFGRPQPGVPVEVLVDRPPPLPEAFPLLAHRTTAADLAPPAAELDDCVGVGRGGSTRVVVRRGRCRGFVTADRNRRRNRLKAAQRVGGSGVTVRSICARRCS